MKRIFNLLISVCCLSLPFNGYTQSPINYTQDALNYSQIFSGGTARFWGLGGAGISLGGDISSITTNPAGLGFYNQSQFSVSGMVKFNNSDLNYLGNNSNDFTAYANIPNIGIVFNRPNNNSTFSDWKGGSFGISVNQHQNFRGSTFYSGRLMPRDNGFIDDFVDFALTPFLDQNGDFLQFNTEQAAINYAADQNIYSQMAFNTYLLDVFANGDNYEIDRYDFNNINHSDQSERTSVRGGVTSLAASYGGNYKDQLFIGGGFNIMFVDQTIEREYIERPNGTDLSSLILNESYRVSGAGFNFNLGVIYKPIPQVNIGMNYKTASVYQLSENIEMDLEANFIAPVQETFTDEVRFNQLTYNFRSPQIFGAGATYFVGKNGFITTDVEYMQFTRTRFESNQVNFQQENENIRNELNDVYNVRLGGEYRMGNIRARAGTAIFGNPYRSTIGTQNRYMINGGLGIRKQSYFIDFTVAFENRNINPYLAYEMNQPAADQAYRLISGGMNNIYGIISAGWNF